MVRRAVCSKCRRILCAGSLCDVFAVEAVGKQRT